MPELPAILKSWDRPDDIPSTDVLRRFTQGMDAYLAGRYSSALELLPENADSALLGDYILYYRAKSSLMLERNKAALEDFQRMASRYPDSPLIRDALVGQSKALIASNSPKELLTLLSDPRLGTGADTLYYKARAFDLAGEKKDAIDLYLRIYSSYPSSESAALAVRHLQAASPKALKGARNYEARLARAETLLREGDASGARSLILALGKVAAPDARSAAKRNLLRGEVEYRLGKTSIALPLFRKVTAAHPELHSRALYFEGLSLRKLDREQAFLAQRDKALKLYPRSSDTEELCYSVATYYDVDCDSRNAEAAYRVLCERFPSGAHVERALWKLALYDYFAGRYDKAAVGFWNYLEAYPNPLSAGSTIYWMGRCYQRLGDFQKAGYLFGRAADLGQEGYYGRIARDAARSLKGASGGGAVPSMLDFNRVMATCDRIELKSAAFTALDSAATRVIDRARQLAAAGLNDLALNELRSGIRRHPKKEAVFCYIMSRIYVRKNDPSGAIACLRRAFPDYNNRPIPSLPREVWDMLFPSRHREIVAEQAERHQVDPTLVMGLIRQESAFRERARSEANARGLMQIMPATGKLLARKAGIRRFTADKLYRAEINIPLGVRYLSSLLGTFGEPELALAAYNAGGSRVDKWLRAFGKGDMVEFVEQVPFSETRGYIKQVLSNRTHYDLLTKHDGEGF